MTKKTCPVCASMCGCATRVCRDCGHRFLPRRTDSVIAAPASLAPPDIVELGPRSRRPSQRAVESQSLDLDVLMDEPAAAAPRGGGGYKRRLPAAAAAPPRAPVEAVPPPADEFEPPAAPAPGQECAFCGPRGADGAAWLPPLRMPAPAAAEPEAPAEIVHVHVACAASADGAKDVGGGRWLGVAGAVVRARDQLCAVCDGAGAAVRCAGRRSCAMRSHAPCAPADKGFVCAEHLAVEAQELATALERDLSRGLELQPLTWVASTVDAPPRDFVYITQSMLGPGVALRSELTALPCCDCADECRSAACACRAVAAAAAAPATPGGAAARVECSLRCPCALTTCALRVVGRPLRFALSVRRFFSGWGLSCPVEMGPGELVCEVVGVVRRAADVEEGAPDVHRVRDWLRPDAEDAVAAAAGVDCPACRPVRHPTVALEAPAQWPPAPSVATANVKRAPPLRHVPADYIAVDVRVATDAEAAELVVDCREYANMVRYLRRGCASHRNLRRVAVMADSPDGRLPRLALVTSSPVLPHKELLL